MIRILKPTWYLPTVRGLISNFIHKKAVFPFYASFKVTSRCHFGCPFCNMSKYQTPDLSTEDMKKIMDNLSQSPVLMTSFEGGEPLLREDIGELLRYARTCKFYLLFTTSQRNILDYPLDEYTKSIDFFHVSIDEGHNNLEMFDMLPELTKFPSQLSVQTVVTRDTVDMLPDKVERCFKANANIVIIPASPMEGAEDCFPDLDAMEKQLIDLKKTFPNTIHTPMGYFDAYRNKKCSTASVIIGPDGKLFYPCHILETKGPDLKSTDLSKWLISDEAINARIMANKCDRNCGWYQYYAIDSFANIATIRSLIGTILK